MFLEYKLKLKLSLTAKTFQGRFESCTRHSRRGSPVVEAALAPPQDQIITPNSVFAIERQIENESRYTRRDASAILARSADVFHLFTKLIGR
jgi:hypothetical protein